MKHITLRKERFLDKIKISCKIFIYFHFNFPFHVFVNFSLHGFSSSDSSIEEKLFKYNFFLCLFTIIEKNFSKVAR